MADPAGRETLPIPDRAYEGLITYDAKDPDTSFPPIEPLRPPAAAPNVLIVLLDDAGCSPATRPPTSAPTAPRPLSDDYGPRDNAFTGTVRWVQLDIDDAAEDLDHLIGPEERLRIAMARQ